MLSTIKAVFVVVSSIPAASSCVVAELSSATALFSFITPSKLSILLRRLSLTLFISFTNCRKTSCISTTAFAIVPVSSFFFTRISISSDLRKSSPAVRFITCVMRLIGLAIFLLMKNPSTADIKIPRNKNPKICKESLFAFASISSTGTVSTSFIPLLNSVNATYFFSPL